MFGKLADGGEVAVTMKDGKPSFELTPAPPKTKPKRKPAAKKRAAPKKKPDADASEGGSKGDKGKD